MFQVPDTFQQFIFGNTTWLQMLTSWLFKCQLFKDLPKTSSSNNLLFLFSKSDFCVFFFFLSAWIRVHIQDL
jgi:hypothetical protein